MKHEHKKNLRERKEKRRRREKKKEYGKNFSRRRRLFRSLSPCLLSIHDRRVSLLRGYSSAYAFLAATGSREKTEYLSIARRQGRLGRRYGFRRECRRRIGEPSRQIRGHVGCWILWAVVHAVLLQVSRGTFYFNNAARDQKLQRSCTTRKSARLQISFERTFGGRSRGRNEFQQAVGASAVFKSTL